MAKESSFFEKLKKGMGIEGPVEERIEEVEKKPKKAKVPRVRKLEIKAEPIEAKVEKVEEPKAKDYYPPTTLPQKRAPEKPAPSPEVPAKEKVKEERGKWFEPEGQLAIDVYQTKNELVIQSAIAGVKPENLDISLERDVLTVKGIRQKPFEETGDYFTQECYWGQFSREVILPVEVDPGRVEATMKEGILTIRIPKILRERKRKISVRG